MADDPEPTDSRDDSNSHRAEPPWLTYKAGDVGVTGQKVYEVIHASGRCVVYLTTDDGLEWEFDDEICGDSSQAATEALSLLNELKMSVTSRGIVLRGLRLIGAGLSKAFEKGDEVDSADFFGNARDFIETQRRESLQLCYLGSAALAALIVSTVGLTIVIAPELIRTFLACAFTGGVGAFVSVSQRFKSVPIERYSSRRYAAISGVSRVIFGTLFGAVLFMFQKAGLVLTVAAGDIYLSSAAAFVAGFSERLIPELLARFEAQMIAEKAPPSTSSRAA